MPQPFPVRAVAGCFALAAFAIAIISGLVADRSTDSILASAIISMFIGQVVGYAAALVMSRALMESLGAHTNPGRTPPASRRAAARSSLTDPSP